ncbi:DUF3577 domain-containing protein [Pseudomonas gingeri]|uniref:DUF3577 domain-containing protein n=1 Tax=Pseudomonas gingeri TaxID=117681 RepID=UPI0015A061A0|nr:DUF3577 domain-containing protein [Pseudomonas gingeri]NWA29725.1 DUF3577 domain-containing protein [Pseudomonas gingeri]
MTDQTQPAAEEKKYFNLYLHGIGYLNSVRTLTRHRQSYLKVSVAVLQGPADSTDYTYIDCTVVGIEAKQLISHCAQEINSSRETVLACFTLSDLWVSPYIHQKGERRSQPGAGLTSNLLSLSMLRINGETVYAAPPKEPASDVDSAVTTDLADVPDITDEPVTADNSEGTGSGDPIDALEDPAVAHDAA